jgi:hypothetical protein
MEKLYSKSSDLWIEMHVALLNDVEGRRKKKESKNKITIRFEKDSYGLDAEERRTQGIYGALPKQKRRPLIATRHVEIARLICSMVSFGEPTNASFAPCGCSASVVCKISLVVGVHKSLRQRVPHFLNPW